MSGSADTATKAGDEAGDRFGDGARDGADTPDHERYGRLRDIYAEYAPNYDRRFARYSRRTLDEAEKAIARRPPRRVLDVACGTGLLGERLRRRWPDVGLVGVDLSPEMLAQAARRLPPRGEVGSDTTGDSRDAAETRWLEGSAESIPVDDAAFDTVVCTNAFHLIQRPETALAEFRRALVPGGHLVIVDWSRDFVSMRLLLAWLRVALPQGRRVRGLEQLSIEIADAGFAVVDAWHFRAGCPWGLMTTIAERRE